MDYLIKTGSETDSLRGSTTRIVVTSAGKPNGSLMSFLFERQPTFMSLLPVNIAKCDKFAIPILLAKAKNIEKTKSIGQSLASCILTVKRVSQLR
tara:strand:- start:370 stop:654 length:285 start_codon:yes stop_codon:yes gene_type:complete